MRSKVELICIDPARLGEFWPHVAPLLRSAIERTDLSAFSDVEREIFYGGGLVWIAWSGQIEAAASTALQKTDSGLVCLITACAGERRDRWLSLLSQIEDYAKAEGCKRVRIIGRKGWQKVLAGYQAKNVILDKELA